MCPGVTQARPFDEMALLPQTVHPQERSNMSELKQFARRIGPRLQANLPGFLWRGCQTSWRVLRDWQDYRDGFLFDTLSRSYKVGDLLFEIPKHQTQVPHRARFWRDTHEREERQLVERHLPRDATVLELGACLGVVSVILNRLLTDPTRHIALEPNPEVIPILTRNRDRNGAKFKIQPVLLSKKTRGTFFIADLITTSSANQEEGRAVTVPSTSVDLLESEHGLSFDALVMDIQGGELAVLSENPELLRRCRCIVLELHPHIIGEQRCEECRGIMSTHGLCLAERNGLVEAWTRASHR